MYVAPYGVSLRYLVRYSQCPPIANPTLISFQMMEQLQARIAQVTFPFLLLQGEEDKIVSPAGSKTYFQNIPSKDKQVHLYPKVRYVALARHHP